MKNLIDGFLKSRFLCLILCLKLLVIVFFQIRYASDFPVTNFYDNDGSNSLYVIMKTKLWNSNGWFPYGPVYYRLTYIINNLSTYFGIHNLSIKQEFIYFVSILVSLLSCLVSFYLIVKSLCIFRTRVELLNLTLTAFFLLVLTSGPPFVYYLMTPHPDYLQAFLITASLFFALKYLNSLEKSHFILGMMILGAAMSVKLSTVYFALGLLISFLLIPDDFNKKKRLLKYGLVISILAYFVVGFPQNFSLFSTFSFLKNQTRYHLSPDLASMKNWVVLLAKNCWPFLFFILFLRVQNFNNKHVVKFVTLSFLISFLLLIFLTNTKMGADHYIFPYFFLCIMSLGFLKTYTTGFFSNVGMLFLTLGILFYPFPATFSVLIQQKDTCRGDIRNSLEYMDKNIPLYDDHFVDAFAPYQVKTGQKYNVVWGLIPSMFEKPKTLFSINWLYANAYLKDPDPFFAENNPDWVPLQKFYTLLKKNDHFETNGKLFRRLQKYACGIEIWESKVL